DRQVREELGRPRACGDDHDVAVDVVERLDAAPFDREVAAERPEREVGSDDPGVELPQCDPAVRKDDVKLAAVHWPVFDAARLEHVARADGDARAELDEPVELEERRTGLPLELAPAG